MINDQNKENAKKIADKYIKSDGTPVDAAFDNVVAFRSPQEADKADETKTLADLAALSPLDYDKERKAAAERLGVSVGAVDRAVRETKREEFKGQGRPLELPETKPWHDPITGADLLDEMCAAIRRYVVLPEGAAETMALWAIHTHAFDSFAVSPRLAFTAPEMQCGKTTALNVVGEMTARPLSTENITTSAVFRTIEIARPTLLIDEADTFLKDNDELRGILNSGHRKGGSIIRTVGDDYEPRQFSTWAPTAISMIGKLPGTLHDRSIHIQLRRRKPSEIVESFRADRAPELKVLARKAARWADDHAIALQAAEPDMGDLVNRAADNWRPLFAVADATGGEWLARVRAIAATAEARKEDLSVRTMLLADIRDILRNRAHTDRIGSNELATELGQLEGRPWAEWKNGKPMTAASLARQLAPFGIAPMNHRIGTAVPKGYLYADFDEAFASYLSDPPTQTATPLQPNNDGPCSTLQTATAGGDVALSKAQKPANYGHCSGVALSKPEIPGKEKEGVSCAQCGGGGDLQRVYYGTEEALLHRDCQDAWVAAQDDGLSIPSYLDRRGELSS
jgi:putative DNA primase/helicase